MNELPLILVADDDPDCRNFVVDLIESAGFSTTTADNGLEALWMTRRALRQPSLLIIDYSMPHMNGFELARELRRTEETRKIPLIMLTATDKQIRESVEFEGVSYINKCSANQEILELVYKAVGKPKPMNAPVPECSEPVIIVRDFYPSDAPKPATVIPEAPKVEFKAENISQELGKWPAPPAPPAPPQLSVIMGLASAAPMPPAPKQKALAAQEAALAPSLIDNILDNAVDRKTYDIHIEPTEHDILVEIRVDGAFQPLMHVHSSLKTALIDYIKALCNLDIAEKTARVADEKFNQVLKELRQENERFQQSFPA